MPVTAKLSQKLYAKLGDEIANELVNWFNEVDATYRSDLRDLNELNFARFDTKLEQRVAQLDAKWDGRWAQLDAKFAAIESRFELRMAGFETRITRWMFLFWVGTLGTLIALLKL